MNFCLTKTINLNTINQNLNKMPHLGLKNTFAIKLAFLAKEMAQINNNMRVF
jgi:hypothetical protein